MEEFKRKLASIRKISDVLPIEGADNIELVKVDGWQCVTKKGEFKVDDPCVYFEIDSFLPIRPEFEFLRKSSYKKMGDKEGFRLKTIRLRGQISQGLALQIRSVFPDAIPSWTTIMLRYKEGDVTEVLGVIKYDPPIPAQLAGICKGNFPSFIRKTDQERVQNIWDKIKDSKESFEVAVKLDGTSCTYYLNDGVFGVCSRNLELIETEGNTLWRLARELRIEEILRKYS
jgi:RNA ligase (TIGR02306 family)